MKLQILSTSTLLFNLVVVKANDQMPLEYVKFPQPIYRGISGEGKLLRSCQCSVGCLMPSSVTGDAIFSGITTFARLPWVQCLTRERNIPFDIAFIGAPFVSPIYFVTKSFCRMTSIGYWHQLQTRCSIWSRYVLIGILLAWLVTR